MSITGDILGKYSLNTYIAVIEAVLLAIYLAVLGFKLKKRSIFPLRFAVSFFIELFLCLLLGIMRTELDSVPVRIFFDSALLLMLLGFILFCYKESPARTFMLFSSVIVTKNFTGTVIPLLRNLFGRSDLESISFFSDYSPLRDWAIYILIQGAFLCAVVWLFSRAEKKRFVEIDLAGALTLSAVAFFIRGVIYPVTRFYQPMSFELSVCVKLLMLIIYALIIAVRSGFLSKKRLQTELNMTEELLNREKKRYDDMRDNIEVVNMKVHDLRRQLANLQGKLTAEELKALSDAVEIYDSNINTGNKILDTVLYQKKLYCDSRGIRLDWSARGESLSFIEPSKLYALLSNALENAVEAVMPLEENRRIISFNVLENTDGVTVEVANYFDPGSSPVCGTSKPDKAHHGFGLKSMRFIADEYGGSVETATEDDMFFLTVYLRH